MVGIFGNCGEGCEVDGSVVVAVVVLLPVVAWILLMAPRDSRDWPASKEEALAGWGVRWPDRPADRVPVAPGWAAD